MKTTNDEINKFRIVTGRYASSDADGMNGAFSVIGPRGKLLCVISDKLEWEHVSVSRNRGNVKKPPMWDEMCFVKDFFWKDDEVVMQLHPTKASYINLHSGVLHLWRPIDAEIKVPPHWMV